MVNSGVRLEKEEFDAVVVGSGATGGWAAKELTEAGLRVLVVEAGRDIVPERDFQGYLLRCHTKFRGLDVVGSYPAQLLPAAVQKSRRIQSRCYALTELNYDWFVDDDEHPYSAPDNRPFDWYRVRALGGRTLVWNRLVYRMTDLELKAASRDGYGEDWPISYADLEPWYDKVEDFIGVSGMAEGIAELPDGKLLPPMKMTCGEVILRNTAEKFGRTLTMGRTATLTVPHRGRPACVYCGFCRNGCVNGSFFTSLSTTLRAALATGRLTLLTNAIVSQVTYSESTGKATGVRYIDRLTRQVREVKAKSVVLCAQALESVRILFNSPSRHYPTGLGNSSGVMGHYLQDQFTGYQASANMWNLKSDDIGKFALRPNQVYVPRFRNLKKPNSRFIRGYGLVGYCKPGFDIGAPGFGRKYKEAVKKGRWKTALAISGGECLPRRENRCEPDDSTVDAWGIRSLRITAAYGDNERKMGEDAAAACAEMLEAAGAKDIRAGGTVSVFGSSSTEVGVARMGVDPRLSVLNQYCQSHDVPNLFVMDGSCFVSSGYQQPTLTMMAIASRSASYLAGRLRNGDL